MAAPDARAPLAALTGATGFLGSHIADALLAQGWRVRASVRPSSDLRWLRGKPVELVDAPLAPAAADDPTTPADAAALAAFCAGARSVIHCAGVVRAPDAAGYRRGNTATTRRLLEAARGAGAESFVLISSLAAGGPSTPGRPRTETDPDAPITDYGRSKQEAEALLPAAGPLRACALRPPALYGPRDAAFVPLFQAGRLGLSAQLGNLRELSLVDGRDVAAAAVALAAAPAARGVYYVDDGRTYAFADLTRALAAAWDRRIHTLSLPQGLLEFLARLAGPDRALALPLLAPDRLRDTAQAAWACDGAKLRAAVPLPPARDLRRGFRETLAWLREEGRL